MAGAIYYTDKRRVIPQLERKTTYVDTRNVTDFKTIESKKSRKMLPIVNLKDEDLQAKLAIWKKTKNYNLAGDILSQAILLKKTNEVEEVKKYLLSKYPEDAILGWLFGNRVKVELTNEQKIEYNAKKLRLEPRDSLTWTDQAINHLTNHDRDESIKCIEEALKLNANLGFIIRNASRIFNLTGDNARAIKLLKNSEYYKYDPQILSAEISFSQLEKRKTNGIEIGYQLLSTSNYKNHEVSELASTLGTTEYFKGEQKKSEKLFTLSLLAPTRNSFEQALWYKKEIIQAKQFKNYEHSSEIQAHRHYIDRDYKKSLECAESWKDEEPYSIRPYKLASYLSGSLLNDYEKAYGLIKQGMEVQKEIKGDSYSEREAMMFNNDMAYFLLKSGKTSEAEQYIEPLLAIKNKSGKLEDHECVVVATLGLFAYKQKDEDLGRKLYRKAIKLFSSVDDDQAQYSARSAFLNFFEEEITALADFDSLQKLKKELDDMIPSTSHYELLFRKNNSMKLFNDRIKKLK